MDRSAAARGRGRFAPEFYVAILVLFGTSFGVFVRERPGGAREAWFRAGFMQPYIPQHVKWDESQREQILAVIERLMAGRS